MYLVYDAGSVLSLCPAHRYRLAIKKDLYFHYTDIVANNYE